MASPTQQIIDLLESGNSASIWLTSTGIDAAPSTSGFSTAIVKAAAPLTDAEIDIAFQCNHFSLVNAPVQTIIEWICQGKSQGKEIIEPSAMVYRERKFDSLKITTSAGLGVGQTIQIFGGE